MTTTTTNDNINNDKAPNKEVKIDEIRKTTATINENYNNGNAPNQQVKMTTTTSDNNNNENAPNHEVKTDYNNKKNDKTTTMTMHRTRKCKILKPTTKW